MFASGTLAAMTYTTKSLPLNDMKYAAFSIGMCLFGIAGRVFLNPGYQKKKR